MGRCKSLSSLKSFIWFAPLLSRVKSYSFPSWVPSRYTVEGAFSDWGLDGGHSVFSSWVPSRLTLGNRVSGWCLNILCILTQQAIFFIHSLNILIFTSFAYSLFETRAQMLSDQRLFCIKRQWIKCHYKIKSLSFALFSSVVSIHFNNKYLRTCTHTHTHTHACAHTHILHIYSILNSKKLLLTM